MTARRSTSQARVRYAETDKMGVVYYANYLVWFEVGRNEYMRACGYPYSKLEAQDIFMPVAEARCRYHASAIYDDVLQIETTVDAFSAPDRRMSSRWPAWSQPIVGTSPTGRGAGARASRRAARVRATRIVRAPGDAPVVTPMRLEQSTVDRAVVEPR